MSWAAYTQLTARNRAIEVLVAAFVLFWAVTVLQYWHRGTAPLSWTGLPPNGQWHHPAALLLACAVHMLGVSIQRAWPLPAILRAIAMAMMALIFLHLSWLGGGQSAMPTYLALAVACAGGVIVAARDARFAHEVHRAS